ncbi:hypothetical protein C0J52_10966 [Blattella germanica]|nr:hypothetical protein C0J52_10966 [Blattella germanica]
MFVSYQYFRNNRNGDLAILLDTNCKSSAEHEELAEKLAEFPSVNEPVDLGNWQVCRQREQVAKCQIEDIHVWFGPHLSVAHGDKKQYHIPYCAEHKQRCARYKYSSLIKLPKVHGFKSRSLLLFKNNFSNAKSPLKAPASRDSSPQFLTLRTSNSMRPLERKAFLLRTNIRKDIGRNLTCYGPLEVEGGGGEYRSQRNEYTWNQSVSYVLELLVDAFGISEDEPTRVDRIVFEQIRKQLRDEDVVVEEYRTLMVDDEVTDEDDIDTDFGDDPVGYSGAR